MKTVLVTGASSGIGKATAKRFLEQGDRVYVAARRIEKMRDLEELGATAIQLDITKDADCVAAIAQITLADGGVDVLVNNAGFGMYGAMEDTTLEDARYQFEVNVFGLARLTQLVLPYMREQNAGKIVNISSMGGKIYTPLGTWYHATKHALEGWSDCLRLELEPFGIRVIIIEPRVIKTAFGDVMTAPMLERSGQSPYSDMAHSLAKATEASYSSGGATSPDVIAKTITRAVRARRPKTRYVAGQYARLLLWLRKWYGDRVFDRVIVAAS